MLYTLAGGGTLCGVAALVLLIVSTATDFWMQYRYSGSSANQGLWRFCINHKCHAHTITVAFWDATRAFMLLAVLSCFAGVVLGLSAFTNGTKNRRVRTGGIALVLSGFLALLALAIYTGVCSSSVLTSGPLQNLLLQITRTAKQEELADKDRSNGCHCCV
ncbi:hypothetical protein FQN60_012843 [Etheostoma spectabile]|uniref:Lens fiber membrane intrinsic protein n=1 Tax=Etheostoma spectabile TaxID=54343 RepID=A0A5J5D453_9PERO|nr:hypothetical protein FQN60_012843 [Etheostoma spectabile]